MTEGTAGSADFKGLVAGLAASAMAVLSQVESLQESGGEAASPGSAGGDSETLSAEEVEKRVRDGLAGARQLIDTLAMLEEKTEGNLTEEEQQLLRAALSELRISYVERANRPVKAAKKQEGDAG